MPYLRIPHAATVVAGDPMDLNSPQGKPLPSCPGVHPIVREEGVILGPEKGNLAGMGLGLVTAES